MQSKSGSRPLAFNPAALAQVRLRKPASFRDASSPNLTLGAGEDAAATATYQSTVLDINIESWYPLIREHTFATEFLPFDPAVGALFIEAYESYEAHLKRVCTGVLPAGAAYTVPDGLAARLDALAGSLQAVIDRVQARPGAGVFVKASSRSAKDAPTSRRRLGELYHARLAAAADGTDNTKIVCMLQAGLEIMKVHTAAEALDLFSRSERIMQDMLLARQRPERWEESFAVRRWVDIPVDMEFRGFVKSGRLTALSQYNHLAHFPRLVTHAAAIERRIRAFFDADIAPRLASAFDDYVVDFAIAPDPDAPEPGATDAGGGVDAGCGTGRIYVIELNPFLETTDGCLFSWKHDRAVIEGTAAAAAALTDGDGSPGTVCRPRAAMRVCTGPRSGAKAMIATDWRKLLESDVAGDWDPAGGYRGD